MKQGQKGKKKTLWDMGLWLGLSLLLLASGTLFSSPTRHPPTVEILLAEGLTPSQARVWKQKEKELGSSFYTFLRNLPQTERKRAFHIYYKYYARPPSQKQEIKRTKDQTIPLKSKVPEQNALRMFGGFTSQNLIVRGLPSEEKNHGSVYVGSTWESGKVILELRDGNPTASLEQKCLGFEFFLGGRYKPTPHFYLGKDPEFYSQFDGKNSLLPQPLLPSAFFGSQDQSWGKLGILWVPSFSEYPGFYFTSPQKSHSIILTKNRISHFTNDRWENPIWGNHNIQSESIWSPKEMVGFFYSKSQWKDWILDLTAYRNSPLLFGFSIEPLDRVKQDLGYLRFGYKYLFGVESLGSQEGIRVDSGYGFFFPIFLTSWGNWIGRYRDYRENGAYNQMANGKGLFYELRSGNFVFSLGKEFQEIGSFWEAKLAYPLPLSSLLELSCMYREEMGKTRVWFQNWTYATDFNMNLSDRQEIYKIKLLTKLITLNFSYSSRFDSENPIVFWNFQFLYQETF